jgi:hypothetical protein
MICKCGCGEETINNRQYVNRSHDMVHRNKMNPNLASKAGKKRQELYPNLSKEVALKVHKDYPILHSELMNQQIILNPNRQSDAASASLSKSNKFRGEHEGLSPVE